MFLLSWHLSLDICLHFDLNGFSVARFTIQFRAGFGTATGLLFLSSVPVCRGLVGDRFIT